MCVCLLGLLGAAVSIVATRARPHLLHSPPQGPSQCWNTDCAAQHLIGAAAGRATKLRSGTVASPNTSIFHTLKGVGRGRKGIVNQGTGDQVDDRMGVKEVVMVRNCCLACKLVCSFVPHNTRVPRAVDPSDFLYLAVSDVWGPICMKVSASNLFKG